MRKSTLTEHFIAEEGAVKRLLDKRVMSQYDRGPGDMSLVTWPDYVRGKGPEPFPGATELYLKREKFLRRKEIIRALNIITTFTPPPTTKTPSQYGVRLAGKWWSEIYRRLAEGKKLLLPVEYKAALSKLSGVKLEHVKKYGREIMEI